MEEKEAEEEEEEEEVEEEEEEEDEEEQKNEKLREKFRKRGYPREYTLANQDENGKHPVYNYRGYYHTALLYLSIHRHDMYLTGHTTNYRQSRDNWLARAPDCITSTTPLGHLATMVVGYSVPHPPILFHWSKRPMLRLDRRHLRLLKWTGLRREEVELCPESCEMAQEIKYAIQTSDNWLDPLCSSSSRSPTVVRYYYY